MEYFIEGFNKEATLAQVARKYSRAKASRVLASLEDAARVNQEAFTGTLKKTNPFKAGDLSNLKNVSARTARRAKRIIAARKTIRKNAPMSHPWVSDLEIAKVRGTI